MRLFISSDHTDAGWEGFNFVINRTAPGEKAVLERSVGGWSWERIAEVDYRTFDNKLVVVIPKSLIGQIDNIDISYKWADNNCEDGDIMSFYTDGNTTPGGRFAIKLKAIKENQ